MSEPNEIDALTAEQAEEYGGWVANQTIYYGGARAFNPGHAVPHSHVVEYGYDKDGLVDKVTTDKKKD